MLIGVRADDRAIFLFGFAKNVLANIDETRLVGLRKLAAFYLTADDQSIDLILRNGIITEVRHES